VRRTSDPGEEALILTDEQHAVVEAARRGESFKITAFAGTGKTTSLTLAARALAGKNVLYLVFNKAQQKAAETRFNALKAQDSRIKIEARTAHSMAWRLFGGVRYGERLARDEHEATRAWISYAYTRKWVGKAPPEEQLKRARAVLEIVKRFLASPAAEIAEEHLPRTTLADPQAALAAAQGLWSQLDGSKRSALPATHDVYLKAWQLTHPQLPWCDVVMYDEAQDATPAMLDIVRKQAKTQMIYVGDKHQQIYEFRGAVNALDSLDLPAYALTQTWRFGKEIAAAANAILRAKKEKHRVKPGAPRRDQTRLGYPVAADLILARTNVGLVEQALRLVDRKAGFFIRGAVDRETGAAGNGFSEIRGRLLAAYDIWQHKKTTHPAFETYASWDDLKEASKEDGGEALRPFVRLVEQHTTQVPYVVAKLRDNCVERETDADAVLSTVHRFKGEEANRVVLAADYRKFSYERKETKTGTFDEGEANIAYVAVTRAREELWMGGAHAAIEESLEHAGVKRIFEREEQTAQARSARLQSRRDGVADPRKGDRYRHATFGIITVVDRKNDLLEVLTEKGKTKHVDRKYAPMEKLSS
jgi:hypothetical protein